VEYQWRQHSARTSYELGFLLFFKITHIPFKIIKIKVVNEGYICNFILKSGLGSGDNNGEFAPMGKRGLGQGGICPRPNAG